MSKEASELRKRYRSFIDQYHRLCAAGLRLGENDVLRSVLQCPRCASAVGISAEVVHKGLRLVRNCACRGLLPEFQSEAFEVTNMQWARLLQMFADLTGERPENLSSPEQHIARVCCPCCGARAVEVSENADRTVRLTISCGCDPKAVAQAVGVKRHQTK